MSDEFVSVLLVQAFWMTYGLNQKLAVFLVLMLGVILH